VVETCRQGAGMVGAVGGVGGLLEIIDGVVG